MSHNHVFGLRNPVSFHIEAKYHMTCNADKDNCMWCGVFGDVDFDKHVSVYNGD